MNLPSLILTLLAAALSAAAAFALTRLSPRLGWLDDPERCGLARPALPYPLGAATVVSFAGLLAGSQAVTGVGPVMVAAILLLGFVCFIDDRRGLARRLRLTAQMIAAAAVVVAAQQGGVLPPVQTAVTVGGILWVLVAVNAMNWADGVPGNASALAAVVFGLLGATATLAGDVPGMALAGLGFGVAVGTLGFEFPVQRAVLGDTGAMFYGLLLAVLSLRSETAFAVGVLGLGIVVVDAVVVVARRMYRRQLPFYGNPPGDRMHLHHRLLARGWPGTTVVALYAGFGLAFGLVPLAAGSEVLLGACAVLAASVALLSLWAGRARRSKVPASSLEPV